MIEPHLLGSELMKIYPSFVSTKQWVGEDQLNQELFEIGKRAYFENRVRDDVDPRNVGVKENHISHRRYNLYTDYKAPCLAKLAMMVDAAARDFLLQAHHYWHEGEIEVSAEVIYQSSNPDQRANIWAHSHIAHDLVVTYYPVVNPSAPDEDPGGKLRFYDSLGMGSRPWLKNAQKKIRQGEFIGDWYQVDPRAGTMVVFEGHLMHDSSPFYGLDRMCIPTYCKLILPNQVHLEPISEVIQKQK